MLRSVFADPVFLACVLALAGLVLMLAFGRRLAGTAFILAAIAGLYALSTEAGSSRLLALVEGKPYTWPNPLPSGDKAPQAIVVLSGGMVRQPDDFGGDTVSQDTLERVLYAARLARASGRPVLVSGGLAYGEATKTLAAAMAETLQRDFGISAAWQEDRSKNTYENARYSYEILAPLGIRRIYLVTDAAHMPRARAIFVATGFAVTPMPTLFTFPDEHPGALDLVPRSYYLAQSARALHEWVGRVAYGLLYEPSGQ